MKYAIFKAKGSQYRVKKGDELILDRLKQSEGEKINFNEVLLLVDNGKVKIGTPFLKGVSVKGEVVSHFKGDKIRVATYKAKSRYRRVKGFRPALTKVKIEKISKRSGKKGKKEAKKKETKK